jgi:hypothetical protein
LNDFVHLNQTAEKTQQFPLVGLPVFHDRMSASDYAAIGYKKHYGEEISLATGLRVNRSSCQQTSVLRPGRKPFATAQLQ